MEKCITCESGKFYVFDDNGNAVPLTGIGPETDSKIHVSFDVGFQRPPVGIEEISDHISEMLETGELDTYPLFTKIHDMYSDNADKVRLLEKVVEYLFESYHYKNNLFITSITSLEQDYNNALNALKEIKESTNHVSTS